MIRTPDPWGYSHPRCRGLPTCSDSTSSPAVKRHQAGILKDARARHPHAGQRSPDGHYANPFGRTNPPGVGHPVGAARKSMHPAHAPRLEQRRAAHHAPQHHAKHHAPAAASHHTHAKKVGPHTVTYDNKWVG